MSTGNHAARPSETALASRAPAHSLIEKLLDEWDAGRIRMEAGGVVIDDASLSWYLGVLGEQEIAQRLAHLGSGWTVIHSLPIGERGRDLDHLVIGPPGAIVINTKHHRGSKIWGRGHGVQVNGVPKKAYIAALLDDVEFVERRLSVVLGFTVETRGMLAFVSPRTMSTSGLGTAQHPIEAVDERRLRGAITTHRRAYSDEQVARIAAAALAMPTWRHDLQKFRAGTAVTGEFAALHTELGPYLEQRRVELRQAARERFATTPAALPDRRPPSRVRAPASSWRRPPATAPLKRVGLGCLGLLIGVPLLIGVLSAMSQLLIAVMRR